MYSSGLRVGEVVRLRRRSLDTDNMVVRVGDQAGRTVRETVLSRYCAELASDYLASRTDDSVWLVPGRSRATGISPRTLHRIFAGALARAGIGRRCGLGCLRHSFAVHMLEDGFDRRLVSRLLGVGSRTTMATYARLAGRGRPWVRSPLDRQCDPREGIR
jgi:site-specific recombinase XerD